MAEWANWTPADLFPQEIADASSTLSSAGSTIAATLDAAATVLDVLALFATGITDINAALIDSIDALIESLTQQLTQTGVFYLSHLPPLARRVNPQIWLSDTAASLDDRFDEERPVLVDPGAFVGAIVVMGVAPDYRTLQSVIEKLFVLFKALIDGLEEISEQKNPGEAPPTFVAGTAEEPNWKSATLMDLIPQIRTLVDTLTSFGDQITKAVSAGDIYSDFANLLSSKAANLRLISDQLQTTLDDLAAALLINGLFVLPIYGQGDASFVQSQMLNSTGGPLDVGDNQFAAGVMFLAQGGTTTPRDALFDMFGLAKVDT